MGIMVFEDATASGGVVKGDEGRAFDGGKEE